MKGTSRLPVAIGEMLWEEGIITKESLAKAIEKLSNNGSQRGLGDVLVHDLGYDRHKIYRAITRIYAFREIDLSRVTISEGWSKFIQNFFRTLEPKSRKELISKKIIPFGFSEKNKNLLLFITPDPTDRSIEEVLHQAGIKKFELAYVKLEDINNVIVKVLPPENEFLEFVKEASEDVAYIDEEGAEKGIDEEELNAAVSQSILVNLFEGALIEAVRSGASDIHIIPKEGNITELHFRIDGRLRLWHRQESIKPEAFLAVVKDRTKNVDRFEWEMAQDGFVQREIDNYLIRFRVSILPIVSSAFTRKYESVVIRVLDDRKVICDLEKLGFDEYAKREFVKAIKRPQGMVILTGPTGSGKSTTLVAALNHVTTPEVNVLTVEDPVEYNIKGARQLKIGPKMNFDQAIRSILRHDPDIVMVGEIRDAKTAEIAIKLANTGHLTFSTLHTNDAASVLSRLYKMGIEPFLIAYAINLVVAQRLMRTLCKHCKKPIKKLDTNVALSLGFSKEEIAQASFYEPGGCEKCKNGYAGRVGIHEVLPFTPEIRHIILHAANEIDEDAIRESAIKNGMSTLRAAARRRALLGMASLEEVASATTE